MQEQEHRQLNPLTTIVITSVVSLMSAYLVYMVGTSGNKTDTLDVAFKRITNLEKNIEMLQKERHEQNLKIVDLTVRVSEKADLIEFLTIQNDHLPVPIWLKLFDPKDISKPPIMVALNKEYTRIFGVAASDYIGYDDYRVWPFQVAKSFEENDRLVLRMNRKMVFLEDTKDKNGVVIKTRTTKFPANVAGRLGVGGYSEILK